MNNPDKLLTPSIFKGPMRFWWRAMMPYCGTDKLLKELRKMEAEIFGGKDGDKMVKSALRIKTKVLDYEWEENYLERLKESFDQSNSKQWNGISYLFFSMKKDKYTTRPCFWETTFEITIKGKDNVKLEQAALSFWLLANLGGIGSRSRRGAGNFVILTTRFDEVELPFKMSGTGLDWKEVTNDLKQKIAKSLDIGYKYFNDSLSNDSELNTNPDTNKTDIELSDYCNLNFADIFLLNNKTEGIEDPLSTLNLLAWTFKDLRRGIPTSKGTPPNSISEKDYYTVKSFIDTKRSYSRGQTVHKADFGLPIIYKYRSLGGKGLEVKGIFIPENKKDEDIGTQNSKVVIYNRSASCLFLGVLGGGVEREDINNPSPYRNSYPLIVDFRRKLLPDGGQLYMDGKGSKEEQEFLLELPKGRIINEYFKRIRFVEKEIIYPPTPINL